MSFSLFIVVVAPVSLGPRSSRASSWSHSPGHGLGAGLRAGRGGAWKEGAAELGLLGSAAFETGPISG